MLSQSLKTKESRINQSKMTGSSLEVATATGSKVEQATDVT
jgi:hypothetical protein